MKSRDEIDRLRYILNKTANLPEELNKTLRSRALKCLEMFDQDVKKFLLQELDLERHTKEEFRMAVSCVAGTKGKEGIRKFLLKEECGFATDPDVDEVAPLEAMCQFRSRDDKHLNNLKSLREMGYFEKEDIKNNSLLARALKIHPFYHNNWDYGIRTFQPSHTYCLYPNEGIFHYLLEWDPDALKGGEFTLLQEVIKYYYENMNQDNIHYTTTGHDCYNHPISMMQMLLKAGLKYHPYELGLLLRHSPDRHENLSVTPYDDLDIANAAFKDPDIMNGELDEIIGEQREKSSPYAMICNVRTKFGPEHRLGWSVIEECLEEVDNRDILEKNPETNIYPFMLAAADRSCGNLDLVFYLLKKNPSVIPLSSSDNRNNHDFMDEMIPTEIPWDPSKKRRRLVAI